MPQPGNVLRAQIRNTLQTNRPGLRLYFDLPILNSSLHNPRQQCSITLRIEYLVDRAESCANLDEIARTSATAPTLHYATVTTDKPGFAGAQQVNPRFITRFCRTGDMVFLGCNIEISRRYGCSNPGAADFIRQSTAMMRRALPGVYDLGSLISSRPADAAYEIISAISQISRLGGLPVLVGCDHMASLVALQGCLHGGCDVPIYIYFDAHFDLGRNCAPGDLLHNGGFVGEILQQKLASHAINIGGRAMATKLVFPETPGFSSIPCDVPKDDILAQLAPLAGKTIYVSIDADALDPGVAPNVSCPEPDGLSAECLFDCCQWLGKNCHIVGADLTEVLPTKDSIGAEHVLLSCLLALKKE